MNVTIKLAGCDGITEFEMEDITPAGLKLLQRASNISREVRNYDDCKPLMTVTVMPEEKTDGK